MTKKDTQKVIVLAVLVGLLALMWVPRLLKHSQNSSTVAVEQNVSSSEDAPLKSTEKIETKKTDGKKRDAHEMSNETKIRDFYKNRQNLTLDSVNVFGKTLSNEKKSSVNTGTKAVLMTEIAKVVFSGFYTVDDIKHILISYNNKNFNIINGQFFEISVGKKQYKIKLLLESNSTLIISEKTQSISMNKAMQ